MDALSLALGVAVARFTFRLWTHDTPSEAISDDVVSIFGGRLRDGFAQREVRRQVERVADQIAERLEPFLSTDSGGIEENELSAAALAAQTSLNQVDALDIGKLLELDLDSAQLATLIRKNDSDVLAGAALSEAGLRVYDTLVSESASFIMSLASQLPGYTTKESHELLSRNSRLASLASEILENLPPSTVPTEWGIGSEDQRFENKYRHAVREFAEQLQLFGVVADEVRRPYPLSVAYISMAVTEYHAGVASSNAPSTGLVESSAGQSPGKLEASLTPSDAELTDLLRVEALLADTDRLLLTGGAGSGKTTLIQWIALSAVAGTTGSAAPQEWQARVPFVIPLRRFVSKPLPTPEQFVEQIAPNLAGAMPTTWVHRTMASGRAAILIDGLDEIPQADREDARQWVLDLVRDFPDNKYLVTSRTTAVSKAWRDQQSFSQAELLPMEFGDIRAFVSHWHEATRIAVGTALQGEVDKAERSLLGIVRDRPAIRALCTSPLLCALICALHLQNASSLPNNRMDVYRTALEMLIHKRDNDRRVRISPAEIDFSERQILLRAFAAWLHENGAADATRDDYVARTARTMEQLHRVKGSAQEVALFMLERSGVLREPIAGRVDFVHRTFLEYLAAAAFIDDDSVEKLVRLAHDDHWREVVILAAGHANSDQRERLIEGLLRRGKETPRKTHRLYLLAVACMETSPQLPSALRLKLRDALQEVLPPKNMTEAIAVSSAGELAAPLLEAFASSSATTAAASVRALSLIGGEAALAALESYRADKRVTVARQLIRAWNSFDTEEYVTRVLSFSPLDHGHITLTDADQVAYLEKLTHAATVYVALPRRVSSVRDLPLFPRSIFGVEVSGLEDVRSMQDLPYPAEIRSITVRGSSLKTLSGAEKFPDLGFLSVSGSSGLSAMGNISELELLRYLDLSGTSVSDVHFERSTPLDYMRLATARGLQEIGAPVDAKSLMIGYAPLLRTVEGLKSSSSLRDLFLQNENFATVGLPAELERADITSWTQVLDMSGGESLTSLKLHGAITPQTLEWLMGLPQLHSLQVVVRDGEIGGWSPGTAVAELLSRSGVETLRVSSLYGDRFSLPSRAGWEKRDGPGYSWYRRDRSQETFDFDAGEDLHGS